MKKVAGTTGKVNKIVNKEDKNMENRVEMEVKPIKTEDSIQVIAQNPELSKSAKMKAMYDLGMGIKDIANTLQVRYNFVYNVISNYCITQGTEMVHKKTESKKDVIMKMFDAGKTVKEIAVELKTNYQYVYKLHKEWKDKVVAEVQSEIDTEKEAK